MNLPPLSPARSPPSPVARTTAPPPTSKRTKLILNGEPAIAKDFSSSCCCSNLGIGNLNNEDKTFARQLRNLVSSWMAHPVEARGRTEDDAGFVRAKRSMSSGAVRSKGISSFFQRGGGEVGDNINTSNHGNLGFMRSNPRRRQSSSVIHRSLRGLFDASDFFRPEDDDVRNGSGDRDDTERVGNPRTAPGRSSSHFGSKTITPVDLNMLRNLEDDYSAAAHRTVAEDRAQSIWACQAGVVSILFIVAYFGIGTAIFLDLVDGHEDPELAKNWTPLNTLLWVVYTATTVGYGHLNPPDTTAYYIFNSFFILTSMAALAIMVAQIFMWMALEARRSSDRSRARALARAARDGVHQLYVVPGLAGTCERGAERLLTWLQESDVGNFVTITLALTFLVLIGALPIGHFEGWSFLQSVYFGIVSMGTIGVSRALCFMSR
jgi:Ion channel